MLRRALLALVLLAPLPAWADVPTPAAPIAAFDQSLLAVMHAGRSVAFSSRAKTLRPAIERAFDLELILRNSVGPAWTSFSPDIQAQLLDVFTEFTVASWVANFDAFKGEAFQILPDLRKVGAEDVVQTRIVPRRGDPTRLDYVMRQIGTDWKAVDILLNGSISRVAVQRSDFRSVLSSSGPTGLLAMLRDKVASLSTGAKSQHAG